MKVRFVAAGASVLLCAWLLPAATAQAGLLIENSKPAEQARADGKRALDMNFMLGVTPGERLLVEQAGPIPVGADSPIKGFGRDVRFIEVLSQVVPPGWKVFIDDHDDLNRVVSWRGNRNWTSILNGVLNRLYGQQSSLKAKINWTDRELHLERVVVAPPPEATLAAEKKAAGPVVRLSPDKTLSENLIVLALENNWRIIWHASADYKVGHARFYQGGFADKDGVLEQVLAEYFTAEQPLSMRVNTAQRQIEIFDAPR